MERDESIFKPGHRNVQIEDALNNLPDLVADQLLVWRKLSRTREMEEAKLYMRFKMDGEKKTQGEIDALVKSDPTRFQACLKEAEAEAEYERRKEKLLAMKKLADFLVIKA